jgi:PST family polysaccharide transporter
VKAVAVLLGPTGVGLVGLYQSTIGVVGTLSGLGINSSGVREVAVAVGAEDEAELSRTVTVLRRVCWATGVLGWVLAVVLSYPLSFWAFSGGENAWAFAVLGCSLLLGALAGGESAVLQGTRRIGDLARTSVLASVGNTAIAIGIYAAMGQRGIVPVMVLSALVQWIVTRRFSRRLKLQSVVVDRAETVHVSRRLAGLGFAFMWSGVLTASSDAVIRGSIARSLGVGAVGQYQAAWAISGMFAGFVLQAMGTDYYPRLTEAVGDPRRMARLVNEQTEIGILLVVPGLVATLLFAPYVVRGLYSEAFAPAAELLPWFLVGIFGRVLSWPLGFIQLAKGASRVYAATETIFNVLHVAGALVLMETYGLLGVALAFVVLYAAYTIVMRWVAGRMIGFAWSGSVFRLALLAGATIAACFVLPHVLSGPAFGLAGIVLCFAAGMYCLRELVVRLGPTHRLSHVLLRIPGWKLFGKR